MRLGGRKYRCSLGVDLLTNNLRVIHHAWDFWFGSSLVITVFKLGCVVAWFTP
ncbi:DUF3265 domain-containing protein [Vibrio parahaemolyticus]|nr:DUF3265 domain-containing protein [Vibrio parahaemolyticus]EGQ9444863.1 DUF3265 domain-containing protein [Vibrio parahaemolyticus]EGR3370831.1 DUF3265 domain-containing protein [Vibrio parahaemolyticus]